MSKAYGLPRARPFETRAALLIPLGLEARLQFFSSTRRKVESHLGSSSTAILDTAYDMKGLSAELTILP